MAHVPTRAELARARKKNKKEDRALRRQLSRGRGKFQASKRAAKRRRDARGRFK